MAAGISPTDSRNFIPPVAASASVASPSTSASSACSADANPIEQMQQLVLNMEEGVALIQAAAETMEKARQIFRNTGNQFSVLAPLFQKKETAMRERVAESAKEAIQIFQKPNPPAEAELNADGEPHQPKDAANNEQQQRIVMALGRADLYEAQANALESAKSICIKGMRTCATYEGLVSKIPPQLLSNEKAH